MITPSCNCPSIDCTQITDINGVVTCDCPDTVSVLCPEGCATVLHEGVYYCECLDSIPPTLEDTKMPISVSDSTYFEDVSFTIAYSPLLGSWTSFFSFCPNYYVSHSGYFQSGINNSSDSSELGMWSHGLTNKSYGIFYGKKYPFEVEYVIKSENQNKNIDSISLFTEARRYHNNYDYATTNELTFNKSIIYNELECSGLLNLIPQKNNFIGNSKFPKTAVDGKSQDILISNGNNVNFDYNYFFSRGLNKTSNIPLLLVDKNQINKTVNTEIVKFSGKRVLSRLQGTYFLNRLSYDKDSRFNLLFKLATNIEDEKN